MCGGTLISKDYVLTGKIQWKSYKISRQFYILTIDLLNVAAHCVRNQQVANKRLTLASVRLGNWGANTNFNSGCPSSSNDAVEIPVAEVIAHEDYNPGNKGNDIALVRLNCSVSESIQPLRLPPAASVTDYGSNTIFTVGVFDRVSFCRVFLNWRKKKN